MKIISILFITIVLLSTANISAILSEEEEKDIDVEIASGSTLFAGSENNQISVRINNKLSTDFTNVKAYLDLSYPFTASSKDSDVFHIGNLSDTLVTAYFTINVNGGAKYGTYAIPVRIVTNWGTYTDEIEIKVTSETILKVNSVAINGDPTSTVNPGEVFDLTVTLKNVGGSDIKWAKITLDTNNDNIVPINSSLSNSFTNLVSGAYARTTFNLSIDKNIEPKNQKMSLKIEFEDSLGEQYTQNEVIGLRIAGEPQLEIARKTTNPSILQAGSDFTLTLKIENIGTADADNVKLQLDSKFNGDNESYLGRIEKDDYANGVFYLNTGPNSGNVPCKLIITYIGSQGESTSEKNFVLSVSSQAPGSSQSKSISQTSTRGTSSSSAQGGPPSGGGVPFIRINSVSIPIIPIIAAIIILIVAVGGAFFYKKKKKNKKEIAPLLVDEK
ncbi:MAG: hypothetical protein GYA60_03855 [Candidatus Methanofastidiosa archaeon]|nr:hypothetical protein [Candidatus Methanofastidiosa archaeon]